VRVVGASPPPFTLFAIPSKVVVYAPAERAAILPVFLLYLVGDTSEKFIQRRCVARAQKRSEYIFEVSQKEIIFI
jgi:hypothetical protein